MLVIASNTLLVQGLIVKHKNIQLLKDPPPPPKKQQTNKQTKSYSSILKKKIMWAGGVFLLLIFTFNQNIPFYKALKNRILE